MGREDQLETRWWQTCVRSAVASFAFLAVAYHLLLVEPWPRALVTGAAVAAISGLGSRRGFRRRREAELSATRSLTDVQERQAWTAAAARQGRPVPVDAQVRDGAARLVDLRFERLDATRSLSQGLGIVLGAAGVLAAFVAGPWWLLLTALAVAFEVDRRRRERRLRARLAELHEEVRA